MDVGKKKRFPSSVYSRCALGSTPLGSGIVGGAVEIVKKESGFLVLYSVPRILIE